VLQKPYSQQEASAEGTMKGAPQSKGLKLFTGKGKAALFGEKNKICVYRKACSFFFLMVRLPQGVRYLDHVQTHLSR